MIIETYNYKAFLVIKNFHIDAPARVYHITSQIDINLKDNRLFCTIAYHVPSRNKMAMFPSGLGKGTYNIIYIFIGLVGRLKELLDRDMKNGDR